MAFSPGVLPPNEGDIGERKADRIAKCRGIRLGAAAASGECFRGRGFQVPACEVTLRSKAIAQAGRYADAMAAAEEATQDAIIYVSILVVPELVEAA